jgi:hypothetical protein
VICLIRVHFLGGTPNSSIDHAAGLYTGEDILGEFVKATVDAVLVSPIDLLTTLWTGDDRLMEFLIEFAISEVDLSDFGY